MWRAVRTQQAEVLGMVHTFLLVPRVTLLHPKENLERITHRESHEQGRLGSAMRHCSLCLVALLLLSHSCSFSVPLSWPAFCAPFACLCHSPFQCSCWRLTILIEVPLKIRIKIKIERLNGGPAARTQPTAHVFLGVLLGIREGGFLAIAPRRNHVFHRFVEDGLPHLSNWR